MVSALALLAAAPAEAQEAADLPETAGPDSAQAGSAARQVPATGLETIYVTARRRARSEALQETPVSATAFSAEQLQGPLIADLPDVGRLAPSTSLQPSAQRGAQNFAIRGMGVSGTTPSDEPAVGIFQDGIYWGSNYGAIGDLFDVEGVEILRGPQGTLFGRNVTGGAILVRSKRPDMEPSASFTGGFGSHGTIEGSAVGNLPIVADAVAARMAFQYKYLEGNFHNQTTDSEYGESESIVARPSIRLKPSDTVDIDIVGEYYSLQGDPVVVRGVETPGTLPFAEGYREPADFFTVAPNDPGFNDIRTRQVVAEINWEVGPGVLTSVTGYRDVRTRVLTDFDGTPSRGFLQSIAQDQDQISTELRYAGDLFDDFLSFTTGVYYFQQDFNFREGRDLANGATRVATRSILDNESYAAFAEVDLNLTDRLTLTGGLRYTEEKKKAQSAPFGSCSLDFATCALSAERTTKDHNLSPKALLSFEPADGQLLFASFTRGFRSGGFSLRGTPLIEPYDAETVNAYEVGYKGDLIPDTVRLNTSLYYNEYSDLQRTVLGVSQTLGVVQSVFNAADATIKGAEVELTVVPAEGLTLAGNYSYTDTDYKRFEGFANPGRLRFVRIPRHQFAVSANYVHELANGGTIEARASDTYTGSYFFDEPNTLGQGAYNLVDASLSYSGIDDNWSVTVWGRNLFEEEYAYWGSSLGALGRNIFPGAPQTWGIRLSKTF